MNQRQKKNDLNDRKGRNINISFCVHEDVEIKLSNLEKFYVFDLTCFMKMESKLQWSKSITTMTQKAIAKLGSFFFLQ